MQTKEAEFVEEEVFDTEDAVSADTVVETDVDEDVVEEEEARELTVEEQLVEAQAKSAENLEGWQRAVAELANARKRFDKQRAEARKRATSDVINELLPVLDDLQLAMANVPETITNDQWFEGINMVPRKLGTVLERLNISKIEAIGHPFDPNCHNAIMREASDEYESGTIVKEYQSGYKMGDYVIRPAIVAVAE